MKPRDIFQNISLKGMTAIITGAGSGIGRQMARRFYEAGAGLHLLDLNHKGLVETKNIIGKDLKKIKLFPIDLTSKGQIDYYFEKIVEKTPDILVNNAGSYPFEDFLKTTKESLERTLDINLKSVF